MVRLKTDSSTAWTPKRMREEELFKSAKPSCDPMGHKKERR
jgi:hypothetical protein